MRDRPIKAVFSLSLGVVFLFLLRCSGNPTMAGGVETTNGFVVVASGLTVHGCAPIGSMVSLFPDSFDPISKNSTVNIDSALIDSERTFSFKQVKDSGSYNVFAINPLTRRGAIAPSLYVRPDGHDSIVIPFDTLGEISGFALNIIKSDTLTFKLNPVYIAGSNFFTRTDSTGYYKMSNIPLGKYHVTLAIKASAAVGDEEFTIENVAELNNQNTAVILNFIVK